MQRLVTDTKTHAVTAGFGPRCLTGFYTGGLDASTEVALHYVCEGSLYFLELEAQHFRHLAQNPFHATDANYMRADVLNVLELFPLTVSGVNRC